jgi:Na+/proline symporter/signal transduction histidine kinase
MTFDIDIAIVVTFLILTLAVGLGHGKKVKTIQDYALGGRDFSTGALVATIVATWIGGGFFFTVMSKVYSDGLFFLIALLGMSISLLIAAYVFVPKMGEFLGSTSIAESMGVLYGKHVRIITAITGNIAHIGLVAVQFKVFGNVFSYLFNLPGSIAIITAGSIVTIYSAYGGIKSVTFTDILQFITFGFMIPMITIIIWDQCCITGDKDFITTALQTTKFNYQEVLNPNHLEFWHMISLLFYFLIPGGGMEPTIFQRIAMGKNITQVKKAFIISAVLLFFITLVMAWVPFLIFNIDSNLAPDQLFGFIIDNYVFVGLKGFIIVGIMAMAMSTADSAINSSAVLFANDMCFSIKINNQVIVAKIFALTIGVFAILLALFTQDLLSIILTASGFYISIVTTPLLLSILGFRTSTKSVLIAMGSGFIVISVWQIANISFNGIIVAVLTNLLFLLGSHYLLQQKGGWVGIKSPKSMNNLKIENQQNKKNIVTWCQEFNPLVLYKKYIPQNESSYIGLGIYCIIYTFTTMYSINISSTKENGKIILAIYQIMMITGVVMAMYPIWPLTIKKEIKEMIAKVWWGVAIFYMLVFFSSFFVMVSGFNGLQFAVFTINTVVVTILLGYKLASLLIPIGFYSALQFYKYYAGIESIDMSVGSPQFIFMYILMLIGAVLLIFLKPKEERQEASDIKVGTLTTEVDVLDHKVSNLNYTVTHYSERISDQEKEIERLGATGQRILNNVNHELRLPVGNVMNFAEMLNEGLDKFNPEQLKMLSDEVYKNSNRLSSMIMNMLDLAALNAKKLELNKKTINLGELVEDRISNCRKIYLEDKKIDFKIEIHPEILISVDPNYMRQIVDNLVINAIKFSKEGVIDVKLLKKKGFIEFSIQDKGIGIPQSELYDIFTPFKMGSNTESKAEGRGVGLALCKAAIEAHGGIISAESKGIGAKFSFVLQS